MIFSQASSGDLLGHRGHGRDAVARVEHALVGQHRLVLQRRAEGVARNILARDYGHHAGHGFGFGRVDAADARGGHSGALDFGVQHAGESEVVDVAGLAEAVQAAVQARGALADGGSLLAGLGHHHFDGIRHQGRDYGLVQYAGLLHDW